ncbi:MAG: hypothetical protein COB24_08945 [Hyphomicrobiales bacterium]|nr:MAG: hypothetical protein COB24_08945 [Hyphomicrobiales bacterium]
METANPKSTQIIDPMYTDYISENTTILIAAINNAVETIQSTSCLDWVNLGVGIFTLLVLSVAAGAYWRQADALKNQVKISNEAHVENIIRQASLDIYAENGFRHSIRIINTLIVVGRNNLKSHHVQALNTLTVVGNALAGLLRDFEYNHKGLPLKKLNEDTGLSAPTDLHISHNEIINALQLLFDSDVAINQDLVKVVNSTKGNLFTYYKIFIPVGFDLHKREAHRQMKIKNQNFENRLFNYCDFPGVDFIDCCFYNCDFTQVENMLLKGCLIKPIEEFSLHLNPEVNKISYENCYVWQKDFEKNKKLPEFMEQKFIVLDQQHFKRWNKSKHTEKSKVDFSEMKLAEQPY